MIIMASIKDCVDDAIINKIGRAKSLKTEQSRDVSAVCVEVTKTPLYSVKLEGHEKLFREGFDISKASTFFTEPPTLKFEVNFDDLLDLQIADFNALVDDVKTRLSGTEIFLSLYDKLPAVEREVGCFYEKFLALFLDLPYITQRQVVFANVKSNLPHGSIDGLIGRCGNGNRPVACVKNSNEFSRIYIVATTEAKLDVRLSGFLPDSRTREDEDLKTAYQPIVQTCAFSEMCTFQDSRTPLICIYGDMNTFRPFLYFNKSDVLLTTQLPFTFNDGTVHIHALALLALLFRMYNHPCKLSTSDEIRKCGWQQARLERDPDAYKQVSLYVEGDGVESANRKRNPNIGPPPIPSVKRRKT